jgi:CBS domain-containing protein
MKVEDVMTKKVIALAPQTRLKTVAETLAAHRISGVPIVEDGRVIGIVSEADIVEKEAAEPGPSLLGRLLGRRPLSAKKAARTARDAMSSPAITVPPQCDVAQAARLMVEHRINRLPVLTDEGGLVGIVARADLVRAFIRSDAEIRRELREEVAVKTLWIDTERLEIGVEDGRVTLAGEVDLKADAELLERFAWRVPGVVSVRPKLRWRIDEPEVPRSNPRVPQPPPHR